MSGPGAGTRTEGCAAHGRISEEMRLLAEQLLEGIEPWAQRIRDGLAQPEGVAPAATCTWCPVCAVVGLLRGERPELAARLAEHAVGLLAVLREVLASPPGGTDDGGTDSGGATNDAARAATPSPRPGVQRVPVRRAAEPGHRGC